MTDYFKLLSLGRDATADEVSARCDQLCKELGKSYASSSDKASLRRLRQVETAREDMSDLAAYKAKLISSEHNNKTLVSMLVSVPLAFAILIWGMDSCSRIETARMYPPSTRTVSAEEITKICAAEAGVRTDQPGHRMTAREVQVISECAQRYINARKAGN
jgi:hypothetical protein